MNPTQRQTALAGVSDLKLTLACVTAVEEDSKRIREMAVKALRAVEMIAMAHGCRKVRSVSADYYGNKTVVDGCPACFTVVEAATALAKELGVGVTIGAVRVEAPGPASP